jgi:hypothetical protein
MGFIKWFVAVAAGLSEYQAALSGYPEPEDAQPEYEAAERISSDNPWVLDDVARGLEQVVKSLIPATGGLVNWAPSRSFFVILDCMSSAMALWKPDDVERHEIDKGLLFEIARVAHQHFSMDTQPDAMWAMDTQLTYLQDDVLMNMRMEVRAFFDAAFKGEFERAVQVGNAVASTAVEKFGAKDRLDEESSARRVFATLLVREMSGTYSAQMNPVLVQDLPNRPIGGGLATDEDGDQDD